MIATKADLGHRVGRDAAQIHQLIAKTAVDMRMEKLRDFTPGKPAVIVKDMNAGPGIRYCAARYPPLPG